MASTSLWVDSRFLAVLLQMLVEGLRVELLPLIHEDVFTVRVDFPGTFQNPLCCGRKLYPSESCIRISFDMVYILIASGRKCTVVKKFVGEDYLTFHVDLVFPKILPFSVFCISTSISGFPFIYIFSLLISKGCFILSLI